MFEWRLFNGNFDPHISACHRWPSKKRKDMVESKGPTMWVADRRLLQDTAGQCHSKQSWNHSGQKPKWCRPLWHPVFWFWYSAEYYIYNSIYIYITIYIIIYIYIICIHIDFEWLWSPNVGQNGEMGKLGQDRLEVRWEAVMFLFNLVIWNVWLFLFEYLAKCFVEVVVIMFGFNEGRFCWGCFACYDFRFMFSVCSLSLMFFVL